MVKRVSESKEVFIECNGKVRYLIEQLQGYITEYGEDTVLQTDVSGYDSYVEYYLKFERDEITEERKTRLDLARKSREKKAAIKVEKEAQELELFVKLREKYG